MKLLKWPIENPFATILISIVMLTMLPVAKNLAGYCREESRFISDDEMLRRTVSDLIGSPSINVKTREQGWQRLDQSKEYTSADEFITRNPQCCQIGNKISGEFFAPSFIDGMTGRYKTRISINGKIYYYDNNHKIQSYTGLITSGFLSNCGKLQ